MITVHSSKGEEKDKCGGEEKDKCDGEKSKGKMQVYSKDKERKNWAIDKVANTPTLPLQSVVSCEEPGTSSPLTPTYESSDELDIPIALRKGTRTCTKHPLSQFVSYSRLSPSYKALVLHLTSVSIPNHVQKALSSPTWKSAMVEEMKALHKNGT